jgi:recA bacterial DNA recombination protein
MYGYAFSIGSAMDFSQFLQKKLQSTPETLPFSGLSGGLPKGKLIEFSGALGGGKTEVLLRFLQENPALQVAWIEVGADIYPCAFSERGVDLSRVLFVEPTHMSEALWCAHQILKSQIFGAVILSQRERISGSTSVPMVIPHTTTIVRPRSSRSTELRGPQSRVDSKELGEIELRRLQIAAEKSGAMVFLLQEKPMSAGSWPLYMQLHIQSKDNQGQIQILKHRGQSFQPTANTTEGEWAQQSIG